MEFIGRVLDGSFGWDLRDLLRHGTESGRLPQDEKIRHLQKVDLFADCTKKQLKAVAAISRVGVFGITSESAPHGTFTHWSSFGHCGAMTKHGYFSRTSF